MLPSNGDRLTDHLKEIKGICFSLKDEVRNLEVCTYLLDMAIEQLGHPDETTHNKIHLLISAFKQEFTAHKTEVCNELDYCREKAIEALEIIPAMGVEVEGVEA